MAHRLSPRPALKRASSADTSGAETGDDEPQQITDRANVSNGSKKYPVLFQRLGTNSSILTLAVGDSYIYAGTQAGEILVWSLASYELFTRIQAHRRAVLCLHLSQDGRLLFSSAGDAIINAWCPKTLRHIYHIYSTYDVGDVFSTVYSTQFETVYFGAQNTSIQWLSLKDCQSRPTPNLARHPDRRNHRFFDSVQGGGTSTTRNASEHFLPVSPDTDVLEINKAYMRQYAHFGYVYCMLMVRGSSRIADSEDDFLVSGGGDGTIKLWKLNDNPDEGIEEFACLGEDDAESVHSITLDGSFLYSAKLGGFVELWDLDTKQKLRVIRAHRGDVMTIQMGWGFLFTAGATGFARKFTTVQYGKYRDASDEVAQKYHCISRWRGHEGRVLASAITTYKGQHLYITGANDTSIAVWNVSESNDEVVGVHEKQENLMMDSLHEFVSYKTISSRPDHAEDCRRGATFLRTLFKKHGAQTEMLTTDDNHNPIVFAKFRGNPATSGSRKKILFYGHYDVVPADNKKGSWIVDPFHMRGINGYLYGRGVSDNKGPIIAALFGVLDLVHDKALESDVIFLIEGEEESGSRGFQEAVRKHKSLIGDVDYILLANSYWLDDEVPCLTYGLRGVLHATIKVDSDHPDVHSGVDGSYMMDEPLFDLTCIVSKLKGRHNRIAIPGFYDNLLPLTAAEEARYDDITDMLIRRNPGIGPAETLKTSLMARWREPSLTIHRYKVSGPDGSLVSSHASASISLRLVPQQEVDEIIESLTTFLQEAFAKLDTHNHLSISIDNRADPWLGDPENEIFQTLEKAIMDVWGPISDGRKASANERKPLRREATNISSPSLKPTPATTAKLTNGSDHTSLALTPLNPSDSNASDQSPDPHRGRKPLYIREGGSIPSIRFLEKEFNAPAAHLPCGQASDSAHLENERLRLSNLYKSREIFRQVFRELPKK